MRPAVRSVLLAGLATAVAVGVGTLVVTADDDAPAPSGDEPVAARSIPLADFDTSEVALARSAFCGRIPPESVAEALGGDPADSASWENGDDVVLDEPADDAATDGPTQDVAHEYGCRYESAGRRPTVAAAWVFAPPVTTRSARDLVTAATDVEGCQPVDDAPSYGSPSVALLCVADEGDTADGGSGEDAGDRGVTASFRGLFGDAWLTCELVLPRARPGDDAAAEDVLDRTGRWCVTVARSASL